MPRACQWSMPLSARPTSATARDHYDRMGPVGHDGALFDAQASTMKFACQRVPGRFSPPRCDECATTDQRTTDRDHQEPGQQDRRDERFTEVQEDRQGYGSRKRAQGDRANTASSKLATLERQRQLKTAPDFQKADLTGSSRAAIDRRQSSGQTIDAAGSNPDGMRAVKQHWSEVVHRSFLRRLLVRPGGSLRDARRIKRDPARDSGNRSRPCKPRHHF